MRVTPNFISSTMNSLSFKTPDSHFHLSPGHFSDVFCIYWSPAPHSSTFAWKIPWMEEPGRLQSMGCWESDMTEWLHFHALEKEMATHSSVLAWRIPGTGEPGGLPSMGSHRLRHDWSDSAAAAVPFLKIIFYWRIISLKNFVVFLSNLNINQP